MDKTIKASILTAIIASLVIIGGISLTDKNVYYCQDRNLVMECTKLSRYYGLENGKCYNPEGNKVCRTGWVKVENDLIIEPEPTEPIEPVEPEPVKARQYKCDFKECIPI